MYFNERHALDLYDELMGELNSINQSSGNILQMANQCTKAIRKVIIKLRKYVLNSQFASELDEINFFKSIKPLFYCQLLYYGKIYDIEADRPTIDKEAELNYIKKEQLKLTYFFEKHRDFYHYYRTGANYMDNIYFFRNDENVISSLGVYGLDTDSKFTTGQDFVVAKIEANERLKLFFEGELLRLKNSETISGSLDQSKNLIWTESKTSLVELIYGLQGSGAFNNGKVSLHQIAAFLEECFSIRLGNYTRTFQDIKFRKNNKTQFLDEIKEKVIDRMNLDDD